MKIVFRDDDICSYTNIEDLANLYCSLGIPVTLGVVPFGVGMHGKNKIYGEQKSYESKGIADNYKLCEYISDGIKSKTIEIALHGYDHSFIEVNQKYVSSMTVQDTAKLVSDMEEGKVYLEKIFGIKIRFFIPPTNKTTIQMVKAAEMLKMNYFGLIHIFDRPINANNLKNLFLRWKARIRYGVPICGVLDYGTRKELWSFKPFSCDQMVSYYELAKKLDVDISFATHYWEILANNELYNELIKFIRYVKDDGGQFALASEVC